MKDSSLYASSAGGPSGGRYELRHSTHGTPPEAHLALSSGTLSTRLDGASASAMPPRGSWLRGLIRVPESDEMVFHLDVWWHPLLGADK